MKKTATFGQLECLVAASTAETWDGAARAVPLTSGEKVRKAVDRLAKSIWGKGGSWTSLVTSENGLISVDPEIASAALSLLRGWEALETLVNADRLITVRLDGYWSHIVNFIGPAMAELSRQPDRGIRLDLAPDYGTRRPTSGAGLLRRLASGQGVDVIVAPELPDDQLPAGITKARVLYTTCLVAVLDPLSRVVSNSSEHSRNRSLLDQNRILTVNALDGAPIAASPHGHWSRTVLERMAELAAIRLGPVTSSPEPSATLAMSAPDLLACFASDSVVPWPVEADGFEKDPRRWVALGFRHAGAHGSTNPIVPSISHALYHREFTARTSSETRAAIEEAVDLLARHAGTVRDRTSFWTRFFQQI